VCGIVASECVSLVCLQETKLDVITDHDVMEMLDQGFGFVYLPTVHTHGGYSGRLAPLLLVGLQHVSALLLYLRPVVPSRIELGLVVNHNVWAL
jgi:hypothetical protein